MAIVAPSHAQNASTDQSHAAIFSYQRIGEDQYPETNIRLSQFEAHIDAIENNQYNVLPLGDITNAFKVGEALPDNTIAITFDGGYRSAYNRAMPLLLERNIPFTIFIATDFTDQNRSSYLDWDSLKRLARNPLVTIGLHPAGYQRIYSQTDVDILRQINKAKDRYRKKLKKEPRFFSYPFGEYSEQYKQVIARQGFDAALAQHSGPAHSISDIYALPRYTMTENHADIGRFQLTATSMPLPVLDFEPDIPILKTSRPDFGFTLNTDLMDHYEALSCFISGYGRLEKTLLGSNRIEFRLNRTLSSHRIRFNCTMPVTANTGELRWRWFGRLYVLEPKQYKD